MFSFKDLTINSLEPGEFAISTMILLFGCTQFLMLYNSSVAAQNLVDENHELIDYIETMQKKDWMRYEDPSISISKKKLEKFEGFDGKNYFVLNKSLISVLIANTITYVLVLIGFKDTRDPTSSEIAKN